MSNSPEALKLRAKIATHERWHSETPELADNARRDLKALILEEHIRRLVDTAPPLTDEQRARLAVLLRPAGVAQDGGERDAA